MNFSSTFAPPALPPDPNLVTQQQQAQTDLITSLQSKSQSDMASLMARYGTQLAIANKTPGVAPTSPLAPSFGGLR